MKKFLLSLFLVSGTSASAAVDYEKDIKPIFEKYCTKCHGEKKQRSELRLDLRESILKGGDLGEPGAVPGHPDKSTIMEFITLDADDPDIMPPKGDKLSEEQIKLISDWIKEGVKMPEKKVAKKEVLWSLKKVSAPQKETTIDKLLEKKLDEKKLSFSKEADPKTLLRRLQVVLTGFLPTPKESQKFLEAWKKNPNSAYGNKVEELLASPHYGERWGQHWLDAIRWAETSGSESNLYRNNSWQYRDYVIEAFNDDKPYSQFIVDQLAGDQTGAPRATGFLVAGPHVPPATVGQEPTAIKQARYDRLDQTMQTLGASMMGMTLGCARCHSHKFDPISIKDYYSLLANFQGIEYGIRVPELPNNDPVAVRGKEIIKRIHGLRADHPHKKWSEDWNDIYEVHIPNVEAKALRITYYGKSIMLDELEIYNSQKFKISEKAKITTNFTGNKSITSRLIDKQIGLFYAFRGNVKKANTGHVTFEFKDMETLSHLTLSRDRKAKRNTDYIDAITYGPKPLNCKIEIQDKNGKWINIVPNASKLPTNPAIQDNIKTYLKEGPQHEFIGRFIEPDVTNVLLRGSPVSLGAEVVPGPLTAIIPTLGMHSKTPDRERRLKFAQWLTSVDNPLTARVMVNRLWYHTFGAGIVSTLSDFGNAGTKPSHPELLDYLADDFMKNGWSVKHMLRSFVHSKAFKQESLPKEASIKIDANSRLLWRYPPRRSDAEVIRDSILKLSSSLNPEIGGKSYRIHNVKKRYALWKVVDNHSESTWRRMIYQERMRGVDDRMFTAFDFPDCGQVLSKRPSSTTPLQALNLMNSKFIEKQCEVIAEKVKGKNDDESISNLFKLLYNRKPSQEETAMCKKVLKTQSLSILSRALVNSNEFVFIQ